MSYQMAQEKTRQQEIISILHMSVPIWQGKLPSLSPHWLLISHFYINLCLIHRAKIYFGGGKNKKKK